MVALCTHTAHVLESLLIRHVIDTQRIAFARLLLSAADGDYAGLLLALKEMGLEVSIDDPEDAMSAMRYLLRGSAGEESTPRRMGSRDRDLSTSAAADPTESTTKQSAAGRRYPVNATPGSVLFLLRVVGCLRGMATTLQVEHSYLEAMRPYAVRALRAALRPAGGTLLRQQQALEVYTAPAPVGPLQVELQSLLEQLCADGLTLGMSVCVYHEGSLLANAWAGVRDGCRRFWAVC